MCLEDSFWRLLQKLNQVEDASLGCKLLEVINCCQKTISRALARAVLPGDRAR